MVTVDNLRAENKSLVNRAALDLTEFFYSYLGADPVELKEALLMVFPELVATYGDMSATVAAELFDEMRREAVAGSGYRSRLAQPPPFEQAERSARWAVQPAFADDWDLALEQLLGASERLIRSAGRETMAGNSLEDPRASGYRRLTRAGSCSFCRMLSDRGAVYSRGTAYFASHDNCRCEVVPSWEHNPRRVSVDLYEISARTAGMSEEQLEAHRGRIRAYLREHNKE